MRTRPAFACTIALLMARPALLAAPQAGATDGSEVAALDGAFDALKARFGSPRVLVEPLRPAHPADRAAASALGAALDRRGFHAVRPQPDRTARTDVADRAVQGGADPIHVSRALEARPDFRLRVTVQESSDEEEAYGIPMTRCTASIRIEATRIGDHRPVLVPAAESTRRSRDDAKARSEAIDLASTAAAEASDRALREAWCTMGSRGSGRIMEVEGTLDASSANGVRVLESVPGVRSIVHLEPGDTRPYATFGEVILERPGYALVFVQPGATIGTWIVAGCAGAMVLGAVLFARAHRQRP